MTDPTPDVPTLRRLLAEATPGPYRSAEQLHGEWFGIQSKHFALGTAFHNADAALIVAAVNALPGVLDRLEAAEGAVARVEAILPAECWVTRSASGLDCTAMIGGGLPNGAKWSAELCCLPCRLRAALAEVTP